MAIPTYSQTQHQSNLTKISELQVSVRPLAEQLITRAAEQGIPLRVVSAYRSPATQQALMDSGKGVTQASALLSYHNHRLAFDVVPLEYLSLKDWNPEGPLWAKVGAIGKALGLEWGGDWKKFKDLPHFQVQSASAPIRELKAYFEKFGSIMPISITPAVGGSVVILLLIGVMLFLYKDQL